MQKTIVLTGGGTAGHVTPHLSLLPSLEKSFSNIYYIGSNNGIEKQIIKEKTKIKYFGIDAVKFIRKKFFANLLLPFKLIKAICGAKKILKNLKPNIIFSKGGFVAVPVILAAKRLKIPVVCHESDLSIGLANKICSKYAKCVCTTFEKTATFKLKNGVFTGSPINEKLFSNNIAITTKQNLNIPKNKKVLLVTGGSLGSVAINEIVFKNLKELTKQFYVIHVVGKKNFNNTIKNENYLQLEFTNKMPSLICASDLVISRAGSNTIFELAFANKPMLLIPLPKGTSRGDQVENANYFKEKGFANVLMQSDLNNKNFIKSINETLKESETLKTNLKNSGLKNGKNAIIKQILKYCN